MRFSLSSLNWSVLILLTIVPAGCTSGSAPQSASKRANPAPQVSPGTLPAPSELIGEPASTPRTTSYDLTDLVKTGAEYDPALPNNEATVGGDYLYLDSWLEPQDCTLADVAYGGFHFEVPGYDRDARVMLNWVDEPVSPDYWYIALANWDTDTWDFYNGVLFDSSARWSVDVGDMDPYLTFSGDCVVVVFQTGPLDGIIDWVRLGGFAPVARIDATGNRGEVPLEVSFDASDSMTADGTITRYEWDLDGNGTYETDTGLTDHTNHTYTENSEVRVGLRVTNSLGATDTDFAWVEAIGDWAHTWGKSQDDVLYDVLQTSDGSIFAVGSTEHTSGPSETDLLLMRISPVGILVWAKTWDGGGSEQGTRIVQMDNGDLVVAGSMFQTSTDVLVQRWTRGGELVWSKRSGGSELDEATALITEPNQIYIAGTTSSTSSGTRDIFLARLDVNGTHYWAYARDRGELEYVVDLAPRRDHNDQLQALIVLGNQYTFDGFDETWTPWKVEYYFDGTHYSSQDLNVTDFMFEARALHHVGAKLPEDERYYVAGEVIDNEDRYSGVLCSTATAATQYTYLWWTAGNCQLRDLLYYSDYVFVNCGWADGGDWPGLLWKHQVSDGEVYNVQGWESPYQAFLYGLEKSRYDGVLTVGKTFHADGQWSSVGGNFSSFTASWVTSPVSTGATMNWSWDNDVAGTVEVVTQEFSKFEDEGGGNKDVFAAHRMM